MASAQVELDDELDDQLQYGTLATLSNHTVADMQLIRSHSWFGSFVSLSETIKSRGGVVEFTHLNDYYEGSTAAVSYTITTAAGNPAAVILAWRAPAIFDPPTSRNKIFAACGPRRLIDSMTWDQIRLALERSTSSVDVKNDGVCVKAAITNNPVTEMADILANFGCFPKP